jgi:hypothetical protein
MKLVASVLFIGASLAATAALVATSIPLVG